MGKLKYLVARVRKMNFKNFFKTIDEVHKKSGKSKIYVFFDAIICGIKYQAGYVDYQLFEMYKMNKSERQTVITRGINNEIRKKCNNLNSCKYFIDKTLFNQKFSKYLHRDWLYLDGNNLKDFEEFLKGKKEIIVKPTSGTCGKGVDKLEVINRNKKELYEQLLKEETRLVEEVVTQCKEISKIHPSSINTVRVVTLKGKVVVALLRMGNKGNIVDNFNHEGLVAPIDIEDGIIKFVAIDKLHNEYSEHPLTHEKIVGLKIPKWNEVKKLCEEAAGVISEVGYVGWDVCIGEENILLIEGNDFPGHDLYGLPPHRNGNVGLLPLFKKVMEEEK